MQLFFARDLSGNALVFSPEESRHAVKVLRLKAGDKIHITDGKGRLRTARIDRADTKGCAATYTGTAEEHPPPTLNMHLAVAPPKNNQRFEWLLEKATEIGVTHITPLLCTRSERKHVAPERLERVILAAAKQSLRLHHPVLAPMTSFQAFVGQCTPLEAYLAHCEAAEFARTPLVQAYQRGTSATLIVGPEGDFTPAEISAAMENGLQSITLGHHRLRTETAALAACVTVSQMNT